MAVVCQSYRNLIFTTEKLEANFRTELTTVILIIIIMRQERMSVYNVYISVSYIIAFA